MTAAERRAVRGGNESWSLNRRRRRHRFLADEAGMKVERNRRSMIGKVP